MMDNPMIVTVLLGLIVVGITTMSVQMYRMADNFKKFSDRLLILETEHKNRNGNNNCDTKNELHTLKTEIDALIQTAKILEKLNEQKIKEG